MNARAENVYEQYRSMVKKYTEILEQPESDIIRDAAIKRFELTFELAWKAMKEYLKEKRIYENSPMDCIKKAYQLNLINLDSVWIKIGKTRNATVHIYNENMAISVYRELDSLLPAFQELADNLPSFSYSSGEDD